MHACTWYILRDMFAITNAKTIRTIEIYRLSIWPDLHPQIRPEAGRIWEKIALYLHNRNFSTIKVKQHNVSVQKGVNEYFVIV